MDRFLLMSCFARAVETGSFSAAGRDLGLGQPNVSRYVAALEDHLQARLLHRSTRKLSLTPEGERYYADIRRILDAVDESESSFRNNVEPDRKSTRLNSSHSQISYAVFCLKKKK